MTHVNVSEGDSIKMTDTEINPHLLGVTILIQFSLKAGLKHFDKKGEEAVTAELTQMYNMQTYIPVDPETMKPQQKSEALNLLIFLTEKRDGKVKSCMRSNSSK